MLPPQFEIRVSFWNGYKRVLYRLDLRSPSIVSETHVGNNNDVDVIFELPGKSEADEVVMFPFSLKGVDPKILKQQVQHSRPPQEIES